jgi:uncharacterized protein
MSRDGLLLAPLAVGHVALLILMVNVSHGVGLGERRTRHVKLLILALAAALTAVVAWGVSQGPWALWPPALRAYALLCLVVGLAALPAVTIARWFRRHPDEIAGRSLEVDLAREHGADALIGHGRYAWMLRIPGNESLRLRRREWEVPRPGLPVSWDGLSIVQVSDLHLAPCFTRRFFERIADEAAAWDADLVVFTGDLVDHDAALDWVVPVLSRLGGRLGSYAILGNHDKRHQPRQVRRAVVKAGFTDLDGRWARLEFGGAAMALGGTSAPWGPALDPAEMPEADFRLLLSHSPDLLPKAARWGVDLMLSGHNHAGQVRLPVVGPVFMPSVYSRHYDRGFFRSGPTLLHVSQGVAGQHPIRLGGCVPEITRLVLRRAAAAGAATRFDHKQRPVHLARFEGDLVTDPAEEG